MHDSDYYLLAAYHGSRDSAGRFDWREVGQQLGFSEDASDDCARSLSEEGYLEPLSYGDNATITHSGRTRALELDHRDGRQTKIDPIAAQIASIRRPTKEIEDIGARVQTNIEQMKRHMEERKARIAALTDDEKRLIVASPRSANEEINRVDPAKIAADLNINLDQVWVSIGQLREKGFVEGSLQEGHRLTSDGVWAERMLQEAPQLDDQERRQTTGKTARRPSLWEMLRESVRYYPPARYAFGLLAVGIVIVICLQAARGLNITLVIVGVPVAIALMVTLVAFGKFTQTAEAGRTPYLRHSFHAFALLCLVLVAAFLVALFCSVVFGLPEHLTKLLFPK